MSTPTSSPSFLVRLRARSRRQDGDVQLPEDHWHAGDPRVVDGTLALAGDVPSPRSPVDRRRLAAVREIDVREAAVLDLRPKAQGTGTIPLTAPAATLRAPDPALAATAGPPTPTGPPAAPPAAPGTWSETSTWLG